MVALAGPFLAVSALLAAAGALKVVNPAPAYAALRGAGAPVSAAGVRLIGATELVIGTVAVATGGRVAAVGVALAYVAFALFVVISMRRPASSGCGCFGASDVPVGPAHLVIDIVAAGVAVAVAADPIGALPDVLDGQRAAGIPLVLLSVSIAYLLSLMLTARPTPRQMA